MRRSVEISLFLVVLLFWAQALFAETAIQKVSGQETLPAAYLFTSIQRVGFVAPEPAKASALIVATDDDRFMITSGHTVYVKGEEDFEPSPGERYLVCSRPEKIINQTDGNRDDRYLHRISGMVEISERRGNIAVGTVIDAFLPIHLNDFLLPPMDRNPRITLQPAIPNLEGRILANDSGQVTCAQGDVVHINLGTQQGLAPGQIYGLFEERAMDLSTSEKEPHMEKAPIGTVLILDARGAASAALILDSKKEAFPGSLVGSLAP